jgi:hypothetical protein
VVIPTASTRHFELIQLAREWILESPVLHTTDSNTGTGDTEAHHQVNNAYLEFVKQQEGLSKPNNAVHYQN